FPKRDHAVEAVRRVTGVIVGDAQARDAQRQLLRSIKRGQNIGSQNLTDGTEGFGTDKGHRDHSMTGAGEPLSPTLNPSRPNGPHSSSRTGAARFRRRRWATIATR